MHEDLKLNKLSSESSRLAKLLVKLALSIEPYKKAAYIEYYVREHPMITELENEMKKIYKDG
jgi:hypothetical protein